MLMYLKVKKLRCVFMVAFRQVYQRITSKDQIILRNRIQGRVLIKKTEATIDSLVAPVRSA